MAEGAGPKHADSVVVLPYRGYGNAERLVLPGRVLRADPAGARRRAALAQLRGVSEAHRIRRGALGASVRAIPRRRARAARRPRRLFPPRAAGAAGARGWLAHGRARARRRADGARARPRAGAAGERAFRGGERHRRHGGADACNEQGAHAAHRRAFQCAHPQAFAGVAAFYRALQAGGNPFFYVSKSPWNLYVPLAEYLEVQGLPEGPLFLRNLGLRMPRDHKCTAIAALLKAYPRLPFILIGDSGENDPEVYADIV